MIVGLYGIVLVSCVGLVGLVLRGFRKYGFVWLVWVGILAGFVDLGCVVTVVWVAVFCGWVVRSWFAGVLGFVGLYAMSLYLCARWVGCLPAVTCDVCTFGVWCLVVFVRFSGWWV